MENLTNYISYQLKNPENIRDTFLSLDKQLEFFHKKGYAVEVRPNKIELSDGMYVFSNFRDGLTEEERRKEIVDLAKLAVGTYFSMPSGQFVDYTKVSTDYLKKNYEYLQMDSTILKATEGDNYYRDVIVDGRDGVYYNDYLVALRGTQSHNRTDTKAVVKSLGTYGKPNTIKEENIGIPKEDLNKQAAFIDIVFYPIIFAILGMVGYTISVLLRIL